MSRVMTRVFCAECGADPKIKTRSRLGTVSTDNQGARWWYAQDRRLKRKGPDRELYAGVRLEHPGISHLPVPETLPAACERHGYGSVLTSDVLSASDTVVLNLIAQA